MIADRELIDITAERSILGSILLNPELLSEAQDCLIDADFSLEAHRRIFSCMSEADPLDAVTLADVLRKHGEMDSIGGMSYISDLLDSATDRPSIKGHAKIVRQKSLLREILSTCRDGALMSKEQEPEKVLDMLQERIYTMRSRSINKAVIVHVRDFAMSVIDSLWRLRTNPSEVCGMSTGIGLLDGATTGIRTGELWIVGALPGRGKTSFGLQVASTNASKGVPTLVFSFEMAKEPAFERLLCGNSSVAASRIRNPKWMSQEDFREVHETAGKIAGWPLYFDDSSQLTTSEMVARAKMYVRQHGVKLIIADYLRLIKAPGRELREQVGNAADCLRRIAKDENVAVIGLSQLSRPQNINDRPTMLSLKESGDIEAHAHVCLLLYQPVNEETGEPTGEDEIIIGKQRHGVLGSERVTFLKSSLTFAERV